MSARQTSETRAGGQHQTHDRVGHRPATRFVADARTFDADPTAISPGTAGRPRTRRTRGPPKGSGRRRVARWRGSVPELSKLGHDVALHVVSDLENRGSQLVVGLPRAVQDPSEAAGGPPPSHQFGRPPPWGAELP